MHSIAIFGGTFDPIHNGHLQTSINLQNHFKFNRYFFLPCKVPVIKSAALANNKQRIKMIEQALKIHPDFNLDLREIERDTPSYMVDTLQSFRLEYPDASINLIIGYDAFISLPKWHQWEKLITLANIIVINRDDQRTKCLPEIIHEFLEQHQSENKEAILDNTAGKVFLFDAGHYAISSTAIREEIKGNQEEVKHKLPEGVYEYIKTAGLYQ